MSEWQNFKWYTHKDATAWFPIRFVVLEPATNVRFDYSLYEFLSNAGYGYSNLHFETREAESGVEFRVYTLDHSWGKETLFQGDAWHLACWVINNTLTSYPYTVGMSIIPYEIF